MHAPTSIHSRSVNGREEDSRSFDFQRWGSLVGGGALTIFGLSRKSKAGLALAAAGGYLTYRGATHNSSAEEHHAESSFAINCTQEKAFAYWRKLENLPRFMRHLESVKATDGTRSEWSAIGPMGKSIRWTAEIVEERENEWIVWRSLPGSDIECTGAVSFLPAVGGRGIIVTASLEYHPPAGKLGSALATLTGRSPEFGIREDLRRFKALMESGEVPTTEGQSHGPLSILGKTLHAAYPEKRKPSEFAVNQEVLEQRSAS